MQVVYLNIAGFIIKLNFHNAGSLILQLLFDKSKNEILNVCGGFIEKGKITKIDFNIDFVYKFHEVNRSKPTISIGKTTYHPLFEEKGNNKILTSNESSINEFQIILEYILRNLLREKGGFFLHASAVNINGEANIFLGKSGGGKSTIMNLLKKNYLPLSDDIAIIKEEKNRFYYYQTPFLQKEFWYGRSSEMYQIGKVLFLRKADFNSIKRINNKDQILKRIIKQLMVRAENEIKEQIEPVLNFVAAFDNFYELSFTKNEKEVLGLFKKTDNYEV